MTDEPSTEKRADVILGKVNFLQARNAFNRWDYERWKKGDVPDPRYPYVKFLDMEAGDRDIAETLRELRISDVVDGVITGKREASEREREACSRLVGALAQMYGITAEAFNIATEVSKGIGDEATRGQADFLDAWRRVRASRAS